MIADTSFLIDLMRKNPQALAKLEEIEKNKESQYTVSPVVFELVIGMAMSDWPEKERQKIKAVLQDFSIFSFDEKDAQPAGETLGQLFKRGTPIDVVDAQIGGIALQHNQKVVTRNPNHFEKIPTLKIETY